MICRIINCNRLAEGTSRGHVGTPDGRSDVCARCGIHFYGNFTPYPASSPLFEVAGEVEG